MTSTGIEFELTSKQVKKINLSIYLGVDIVFDRSSMFFTYYPNA